MPLPAFAEFPPSDVRRELPPAEWEVCLGGWIFLADVYLRQKDEDFSPILKDDGSLPKFLISIFTEWAKSQSPDSSLLTLRRKCFLLIHRIYSGNSVPSSLLHWTFLADLGHVFPRSETLRALISTLWQKKSSDIEAGLQKVKTSLTRTLDAKNPEAPQEELSKLCHLLSVSPDAGVYMLTGSDFFDSLCAAYSKLGAKAQSKLVTVAYLGLMSLLRATKPRYSMLSDHLYSLKSNAEQEQKAGATSNLLSDLVTNTPILSKVRDSASASEGTRVKSIATSLAAFQLPGRSRPKRLVKRKIDKGKGRATDDEYGHGTFGEVHVHRMSLVTQIQELFPDLGSAFVVKLLDEYNDDVEQVTAHLLEGSLPPHLNNADRSEQLPTPASSKPHFTPRSTPPPAPSKLPERRNVFDNDALDQLTVSASQLHIGRKNGSLTADNLLSDRSAAPNKAAILSALASFDSDDDERDDTYDANDVGGAVDTTMEEADVDKNEEALFRAYSATPELFARDAQTKRSKARLALKEETGMTDEAIEGWGIMVGRDPRRLKKLEAQFSTFSGQQSELAPTAWRASPAESGADDSSAAEGSDGRRGGRGGFQGRGRGGGGRGRGRGGRGRGNVAGPSDDKGTQIARRRKEANKGQRAREGRAKKMARAGFPG